jgi:pectate lyase
MLARRFIVTASLVLFVLVIIESTTGGLFLAGNLLPRTDIPSGTQIVRVTNLNADGAGSLRSAVTVRGPKIIVFEVGGVIDLRSSVNLLEYCYSTSGVDPATCVNSPTINIEEDGTIIAGETAPPPGITLIGGAIRVHASNVIVRNIAVRMGKDTGALSKQISNGLKIHGEKDHPVRNILIENNSFLWAVDETASIFVDHDATKPNNYDSNAISDVTLRYNIFGEGLSCGYKDTSSDECKNNPLCALCHDGVKQHAQGTLIANGSKNITIDRNLYIHNDRRNPWIATDTTSLITNNLIYNPGRTAIEVNGCPYTAGVDAASDFNSPQPGPKITARGNLVITGKDSGLAIRSLPDPTAACGRETGRIVHVNECIPADATIYQQDNVVEIRSPDGTTLEGYGADWAHSTDVRAINFPGTDQYCPALAPRVPLHAVIAQQPLADWTPITAHSLLPANQVEATLLNTIGPSVWENKVQNLRWRKDPHDARLRSDVALRRVNGRRQSDPLLDLDSIKPLVTTQDDVCGVHPVTGAYDVCGYPRASQSAYATQTRSFDLTTLDPIPSGFLSATPSSEPTSSSSTTSSLPRIVTEPLASLANGLIASFAMNDPAHLTKDSSPLLSDASFSQLVTGATIDGEQVAVFTAARNAYMSAESTLERQIGSNGFSISGWIRPTGIGEDSMTAPLRGILAKSPQGGFGTSPFQLYHNNKLLRFTIGDGTRIGTATPQADIVDSTVCLQNDVWHFFTAWYDPTLDKIGISVNDEPPVLVSAINTSGFQSALDSGPLFIGSIFSQPHFSGVSFDGAIDDVRVWNRTLTSTERANVFATSPLRSFVRTSSCQTYARIDDSALRGFYGPRFASQSVVSGYPNTQRTRTRAPATTLPDTLSMVWLFQDLDAGTYDVLGTWKEASGNATQVPLTIKIPGTATSLSASLNQTLAPTRSFFSDGRWWQKVGTVTVDADQSLRVQMFPGTPTGSQSVGDAFMIVRQ